jgi:hypothetical protein
MKKITTKLNFNLSFSLLILLFISVFNGVLQAQVSNYVFSASSGTFVPLTGGTIMTLSGGTSDDGYYNNIPLGFNFNYDGATYNTAAGCTNGWLSLIGSMTENAWTNNLTSGISAARPILAPLWDDHDGSGITFTYKTDYIAATTDSVFTAEWLDVDWQFQGGSTISFQVKLFKNSGNIQFIYRQETTPVSFTSASIGISSVTTGTNKFLSLNGSSATPSVSYTVETTNINTKPATGQIYQFAPPTPAAPIMITGTKTNVLTNSVTLSGIIVGNTFPAITTSGVVVGTSPSPTIGDPLVIDSITTPIAISGSFTKDIVGLNNSTTYFYRAYAINSIGTTYGADSTFTTNSGSTIASINSIGATGVSTNSSNIGGTIVNNGGDPITTSGVVYATTSMPTIGGLGVVDSVTNPNISSGSFNFILGGLTHSTKYYYRAYAINSIGTAYSVQDSFTTAPIVSALPYSENFDAPTTNWTTNTINGGTNAWEKGSPTKTNLNGPFSAPNCFVTKLSGNYLGTEDCGLTSPQFDFSGLTVTPVISFKHKFDESNDVDWDGGVVEISINNGAWTRLDNNTGTGSNFNTLNSTSWYNNSAGNGTLGANKFNDLSSAYASQVNGWITSITPLTGAMGQSNVKVRFRFWADGFVDEGWAIDNIEVFLPVSPSVSTNSNSNITSNSATLSGNILFNGYSAITESGVVYSTSPAPVRGALGVVDSASSPLATSGVFSRGISGLNNSTTYYYRAYAKNDVGITYGPDSVFTTNASSTIASINRNTATLIQATSAVIGGTIVNNGGDPITLSGVVFSTSSLPTISGAGVIDSVTTPNISSGSFNFTLAGLTHSTKYYYRAYAINSIGTAYSTQDSFTTSPIISVLPYSQNFDTVNNNNGWGANTVSGVINPWQLGTPAKININNAFSAPNAWVTNITGNYANSTNAALTSPQFDFSSQTVDPILRFQHKFRTISGVDLAIVEISINNGPWAALDNNFGTGTNFNSSNGSLAWYNGPNNFWTTTSGAVFTGNSTGYATQSNGWIQSTTKLTGAAGQSNVKVRLRFESTTVTFFGTNEGWAVDNIEVFPPVAPTVVTGTKSGITTNIATLSGNIISNGNATITESGVVFSTLPSPVRGAVGVVDSASSPLATIGLFSKNISGLSNATTYYYRAYAKNAVGTSYGADSTFTTNASATLALINSNVASAIGTTVATVGGTIVNDGGDPITVSGVVFSTSSLPTIGASGVIDSVTTPNVALGSFNFNMVALTHSTKYYYRAYAINSVGTAYSNQDSFTTSPIVSSLPYVQNFDAVGNSGWTTVALNGRFNSWELGTPVKTFMNSAYSAPNAYVTKLIGNYGGSGDEEAALVSPQFDFSTVTSDPILRFRNKHKTNNDPGYDCGVVEISVNNGPWTRLNNQTGTGTNFNTLSSYAWHNLTNTNGFISSGSKFTNTTNNYASQVNGWVQSATTLTGAAGQSNVKFRFHFAADDIGTDEGWAIDDIEVVALTTPTVTASLINLTPNPAGAEMNVSFTVGNGQERIVVARLTTNPAIAPYDSIMYTANPVFGSLVASSLTGLGNYIVYKGTGNSVNVSGLANFTDYTFDVYEYNGKYMHNKFSAASSNNNMTLPVKLLSFNGITKNNDVVLKWVTVSEINNKGFEVERSFDARTFKTIGFVKGAGNSNATINYNLLDAGVLNKSSLVYYRLKQIDFDGTISYSQIIRISLNGESKNSVAVFPNPFTNDFNISFVSNVEGNITYDILDIQGKVIVSKSDFVMEGSNTIVIDNCNNFNSGIYFVRININGETQVMKLVKN